MLLKFVNLIGSIRAADTCLASKVLDKHTTLYRYGRHVSKTFVGILLVACYGSESKGGYSCNFQYIEVHVMRMLYYSLWRGYAYALGIALEVVTV